MNYYKLQVHFGNSEKPTITEFKNLQFGENGIPATPQLLAQQVYQGGIKIALGPNCWELISPFLIHKVLLIKQDGKE